MNTKQVWTLYESSVRKLKKQFQAETSTLTIVKSGTFHEILTTIAVCQRLIDSRINLTGATTIWPERVLKYAQTQRWDEESISLAIMETACHEVSHHLDAYRMAKEFRNLASHGTKGAYQHAMKVIHDPALFHADGWKSIMEGDMGTPAIPFFNRPTKLPKIYVR